MIRITNPENCCGCHSCWSVCPVDCISMEPDAEGFLYPKVNENICNGCGLCEEVCPMLSLFPDEQSPKAYAAWSTDDVVRMGSSSGGVFSVLMSRIFDQGGVVFGAAFDEAKILRHQVAENKQQSYKLRGSKYLQSAIANSYKRAEGFIKSGRNVLFSGTPCQIAGLYSFLGKDYENLVTCDLVCHGVPSPKVFNKYLQLLETRYKSKSRDIVFKNKQTGWKRSSLSILFENNKQYLSDLTTDPFLRGFLADFYLRPSCHNCRFSRFPRIADLSLGDFWGVGRFHPEWDDDKGTSLVLVQTDKGEEFFRKCFKDLVVHEALLDNALKFNPCINSSVLPGEKRNKFFNDLDKLPFKKVLKKYMSVEPLHKKILKKINQILRKGLGKCGYQW